MNKEPKKPMNTGNWIGTGPAVGGLGFVLTSEPVWIAIGVAICAALEWKRRKKMILRVDGVLFGCR
jgi:hypothetical protein